MVKKSLKLTILSLLVISLLLCVALFLQIPRSEISLLKSGYVESIAKDNTPKYKVTSKRPHSWVSLKQMSPYIIHAVVVSEDWSFFEHEGVDFSQLKLAAEDALLQKRLRGASTLSQQVVKNIFLTHNQSIIRKLREAVITYYLERNVPKEKILEVYLNMAHWGDKIYGVKAASRKYFNIHPKKLNPAQAAYLALLLPSPVRYAESFKQKKLTDFAKKVSASILMKMKVAKILSEKELNHWLKVDPFLQGVKLKKPKRIKFSKRKLNRDGHELSNFYGSDPDLGGLKAEIQYDEDAINDEIHLQEEEFSLE